MIWQEILPKHENARKRDNPITWKGPYLAGNRLMIIGSNGAVRDYNPIDGSLIREWSIGRDILLPAAFANNAMYLYSDNVTVSAYR
jgi:hypothetical protein